jgi:PAS domain S-box-containing protein
MKRAAAACCNVDSASSLLALIDEPVFIADLDGTIAGWSRGAEQLLGYTAAEVLGRDSAELHAATTSRRGRVSPVST